MVVDRDGDWEDGFFVELVSSTIAIGDYSKSPRSESGTRLRAMSPETARRLAVELVAMADLVEAGGE